MFALSRFTQTTARRVLAQHASFSSASTRLIINAVGQDRLGIVSDIAGIVIDAGGNVGESQAAKLGSHFSLMMLVDVPAEKLDALKLSLDSLKDMNAAVFEAASDGARDLTPAIGYSGYFTLEGADHQGIVHTVTSALAKHGLSIDKMETEQEIAPYGGTVLFKMRGTANAMQPLPKSFDIAKIKKELKGLGDALNCDLELEDALDESDSGAFYAG